jgi:hypothetical protein
MMNLWKGADAMMIRSTLGMMDSLVNAGGLEP